MEHSQPTSRQFGFLSSLDLDTTFRRVQEILTFRRKTVTLIASDRNATLQAAMVVCLTGLATAVGMRWDVLSALVAVLIGWVGLSGAVWFVANRFMSTPTSDQSFQRLLRAIGYAQAPASLVIVHGIWGLGPIIAGIGTLWSFGLTIFAIRHTTGFGYLRATALALAGGLAVSVFGVVIAVFTGIYPQIW